MGSTLNPTPQVQALRNDEDAQREVVAQMQATTPGEMYHKDLDEFLAALEEHEFKERKLLDSLAERQMRAGNKGNATRKVRMPLFYPETQTATVGGSEGVFHEGD